MKNYKKGHFFNRKYFRSIGRLRFQHDFLLEGLDCKFLLIQDPDRLHDLSEGPFADNPDIIIDLIEIGYNAAFL